METIREDKPLVSVIVPIYNVEPYLRKCVDSIIAQTYRNLEIILVDDGSPDNCPQICEEYREKDSRIKVIHKPNGGQSSARNNGLDIMTGEYVTFIDGDDYYEKHAIEKIVTGAVDHEADIAGMGAAIVSSNYAEVNEEDSPNDTLTSEQYFIELCNGTKPASVCTKIFKSCLFDNYRFCVGRVNEDFLLLASMLFENIIVTTISFVGYYYYQRHGSTTHSTAKPLSDAIQNCVDLMKRADLERPELKPYIARMGLHQASVLVRVIPDSRIDKNNEYLKKTSEAIKLFKPYVRNADLKLHEKIIVVLVDVMPVASARLLRLIRRKRK